MQVTFAPEIEAFIDEQLKAGAFTSRTALLEVAVQRMMMDDGFGELDDETLAAIEEADAQCDRGECLSLDEAFAQIRHKHFGK